MEGGSRADGDRTGDRAIRLRNWWGLGTYAVGGLGMFWGLVFVVTGLLAVFGTDTGTSSIPLAGAFAAGIAAGVGVILLVTAVPLVGLAVLVLLSGRGVRRGSRRWWRVGMGLYALGSLLAIAAESLTGVAIFGVLLALGLGCRRALS